MRRPIFKIALAFLFSVVCCLFVDFYESTIIESSFILSTSLEILGVALAVTAIFFTVIDRYKDKHNNKTDIEKKCFPVLKEMCENVFGIFVLVIFIFIISILEAPIDSISLPKQLPEITLSSCLYLFSFTIVLLVVYDIVKSILALTVRLFISNPDEASENNDKYIQLVELCKRLDKDHFSELLEYVETLVVKQELKKNSNHTKK